LFRFRPLNGLQRPACGCRRGSPIGHRPCPSTKSHKAAHTQPHWISTSRTIALLVINVNRSHPHMPCSMIKKTRSARLLRTRDAFMRHIEIAICFHATHCLNTSRCSIIRTFLSLLKYSFICSKLCTHDTTTAKKIGTEGGASLAMSRSHHVLWRRPPFGGAPAQCQCTKGAPPTGGRIKPTGPRYWAC